MQPGNENDPFRDIQQTLCLIEANVLDDERSLSFTHVRGGADPRESFVWLIEGTELIMADSSQILGRRHFDHEIVCACQSYIEGCFRLAVSLKSGELYFVHPTDSQFDSRGRLYNQVQAMTFIGRDKPIALCLVLVDNSIALIQAHDVVALDEIVALAHCVGTSSVTCAEFIDELDVILIGFEDGSLFEWRIGTDVVSSLRVPNSHKPILKIAYDAGLFHGLLSIAYGPSNSSTNENGYCSANIFRLKTMGSIKDLSLIGSVTLPGRQISLCHYLGSGRNWAADTHSLDFAILSKDSEVSYLTVLMVDLNRSSASSIEVKLNDCMHYPIKAMICCGFVSPYTTTNHIDLTCLAVTDDSEIISVKLQFAPESERVMRVLTSRCDLISSDPDGVLSVLRYQKIVQTCDLADDPRATLLNCIFRLGLTFLIHEYIDSLRTDKERHQVSNWIQTRLQHYLQQFNQLLQPGRFSAQHLQSVQFLLQQIQSIAGQDLALAPSSTLQHSDAANLLFDLKHNSVDVFNQARLLWQDSSFHNRQFLGLILPSAMNQSPPFHFIRDIYTSACSMLAETRIVVLYVLCAICPDHSCMSRYPELTAFARTLWHLDQAAISDTDQHVAASLNYLGASAPIFSKTSLGTAVVFFLLHSLNRPKVALKASRILKASSFRFSDEAIRLHCQSLLCNQHYIECLKLVETLHPSYRYVDAFLLWFVHHDQIHVLCALPLSQEQIGRLGYMLGDDALIVCELYRSQFETALQRYTNSPVRQKAIYDAVLKYHRTIRPNAPAPSLLPATADSVPLFSLSNDLLPLSLFTIEEHAPLKAAINANSSRNLASHPSIEHEEMFLSEPVLNSEILVDRTLSVEILAGGSGSISETIPLPSLTGAVDGDFIMMDESVANNDGDYSSIEFASDRDEVLDGLSQSAAKCTAPVHIDVIVSETEPNVVESPTVCSDKSEENIIDATQRLEADNQDSGIQISPVAGTSASESISQSADSESHLQDDENDYIEKTRTAISVDSDGESAPQSNDDRSQESVSESNNENSIFSAAESVEGEIEEQQLEVYEISSASRSDEIDAGSRDGEIASSNSGTILLDNSEIQSGPTSSMGVKAGSMLSSIGASIIGGIVSVFSGPRCPAEETDDDQMDVVSESVEGSADQTPSVADASLTESGASSQTSRSDEDAFHHVANSQPHSPGLSPARSDSNAASEQIADSTVPHPKAREDLGEDQQSSHVTSLRRRTRPVANDADLILRSPKRLGRWLNRQSSETSTNALRVSVAKSTHEHPESGALSENSLDRVSDRNEAERTSVRRSKRLMNENSTRSRQSRHSVDDSVSLSSANIKDSEYIDNHSGIPEDRASSADIQRARSADVEEDKDSNQMSDVPPNSSEGLVNDGVASGNVSDRAEASIRSPSSHCDQLESRSTEKAETARARYPVRTRLRAARQSAQELDKESVSVKSGFSTDPGVDDVGLPSPPKKVSQRRNQRSKKAAGETGSIVSHTPRTRARTREVKSLSPPGDQVDDDSQSVSKSLHSRSNTQQQDEQLGLMSPSTRSRRTKRQIDDSKILMTPTRVTRAKTRAQATPAK